MMQLFTQPEAIIAERVIHELMPSEQDKERIHELVMFWSKSLHIRSEHKFKMMENKLNALQVSGEQVFNIVREYVDEKHMKEWAELENYYFQSLNETIKNSNLDDKTKIEYQKELVKEHTKNSNNKILLGMGKFALGAVAAVKVIAEVGKVISNVTEDPSVKKMRIKQEAKIEIEKIKANKS